MTLGIFFFLFALCAVANLISTASKHSTSEREMRLKEEKLELDRARLAPMLPKPAAPVSPTAVVAASPAAPTLTSASGAALSTIAASQEEMLAVGEASVLLASSEIVVPLTDECSIVIGLFPEFNYAERQLVLSGTLRDRFGAVWALDTVTNLKSLTEVELEVGSISLGVSELDALLARGVVNTCVKQAVGAGSRKAA